MYRRCRVEYTVTIGNAISSDPLFSAEMLIKERPWMGMKYVPRYKGVTSRVDQSGSDSNRTNSDVLFLETYNSPFLENPE
jgi:hypothetical protein